MTYYLAPRFAETLRSVNNSSATSPYKIQPDIAAGMIAVAIFVVGAFLMTISAGNDTLLQAAKRALKGSLIGIAIVTGSYGIYRTVQFLLFSG